MYKTYAIRLINFIITQFLGIKNVGIRANDTNILPCSVIESSKGTVTLLAESTLSYLEQLFHKVDF